MGDWQIATKKILTKKRQCKLKVQRAFSLDCSLQHKTETSYDNHQL
ncbi:hypothetical protein SLEP1_g30204 [Rubroshorea leprosula]|uniref:Uncharacterized protein n=1 Tax=Rubroshorea leprosula TaxID=152421 RepID=A0AAV5K7W5_9ROSI|nr:hypothetical protein SLEP1_g30204 [Rubroshorea leprosula]